jgi:hypothetical protein
MDDVVERVAGWVREHRVAGLNPPAANAVGDMLWKDNELWLFTGTEWVAASALPPVERPTEELYKVTADAMRSVLHDHWIRKIGATHRVHAIRRLQAAVERSKEGSCK